MNTTYADIDEGKRLDIAVEFITQRGIDCDGKRVHRLLVADQSGKQFPVLATLDSAALLSLKTGAMHRISGMLGALPATSSKEGGAECPHCGGELRAGRTVDAAGPVFAEAAAELSLDEPFGIIDARATARRVREDRSLVDDWTPMDDDRSVTPPDYVCESCGRHVDAYELRETAETDQMLENQVMESASPAPASVDMASPETVGLAAGGAKDVANFRENVANGYTPQPEAISDEGLFYDYHFETGTRTESEALFAPRYAAAVSDHPISGETERYLSVGLDSTLSVDEFERPRLDLVAVLDVSGSMDSAFDAYYYDEHGRKREAEDDAATKLEAATQSLCALTEQLHDEDRLGVVLYNHRAHVAKPLRDIGTTDMPAIRRHIREIAAGGSTNLADGFEAAVDMLVDETPSPDVERRVVFMTDMMPNTGATGDSELTQLFADAAAEGVHTTFIGMGLDANAELADTLSGIRGANHYFVHSASEFERRLGDEFDYMVTPLVYDLNLDLDADGYEIEAVHGSPSADAATDRLMHVGTLFPSAKQDGEARGGVVLVRLEQTSSDADLDLVASWTERDGGEYTERVTVDVPDETGTYSHKGVRKAVALARYARELRTWAADLHDRADAATGVDDWLLPDQRGQHERESVPLVVPDRYTKRFDRLRSYLADEMAAVGDETIQQEVELLETLCQKAPTTPHEVSD
ncbi:vWA domain-containing protein [Halobacterium jilantaiense]|uniref:Ca-activated chloride channel family protein n=1 Tax=Halobacterium jilantaiense TaxID=355548 RepID=A0A1I0R2R7_9EURY|nr:VWA domain-containing protein [Halobacterium jilantaiense]SEW34651.1 Ca-activated chloride channel family protein [Halobacterium jilantaiense]